VAARWRALGDSGNKRRKICSAAAWRRRYRRGSRAHVRSHRGSKAALLARRRRIEISLMAARLAWQRGSSGKRGWAWRGAAWRGSMAAASKYAA
jgi:hypothetical protein